MHQPISNRQFRKTPPAAMMDERGALMMCGGFVGAVVAFCFVLSAIALSAETGATAASLGLH